MDFQFQKKIVLEHFRPARFELECFKYVLRLNSLADKCNFGLCMINPFLAV